MSEELPDDMVVENKNVLEVFLKFEIILTISLLGCDCVFSDTCNVNDQGFTEVKRLLLLVQSFCE